MNDNNDLNNIEMKIGMGNEMEDHTHDNVQYKNVNDKEEFNATDSENLKSDMIDDIVNNAGITRYHYKIYTVISLFFLADGAEMIVISLLVSKLGSLWNLNDSQKGFMGSAVFVGFFFGALMAGKLSDTRGRKPVYIVGSLIVSIFSTLSALSPNYMCFIAFRALNGFGIGMCIPSASSLAAEITPTKWRAWVLNCVWIFFPFGEVFAVLLANAYIDEDYGWRLLLGFAAVPAFIAFGLSFFI